jgi:hypothetical protein
MKDAERYEARHPQTGVGEAQAAERQQRADLKQRVRAQGRRNTASIIVPRLPWLKED